MSNHSSELAGRYPIHRRRKAPEAGPLNYQLATVNIHAISITVAIHCTHLSVAVVHPEGNCHLVGPTRKLGQVDSTRHKFNRGTLQNSSIYRDSQMGIRETGIRCGRGSICRSVCIHHYTVIAAPMVEDRWIIRGHVIQGPIAPRRQSYCRCCKRSRLRRQHGERGRRRIGPALRSRNCYGVVARIRERDRLDGQRWIRSCRRRDIGVGMMPLEGKWRSTNYNSPKLASGAPG